MACSNVSAVLLLLFWFGFFFKAGLGDMEIKEGRKEGRKEGTKEMFYLTTHSTHFIYGYMVSSIW